MCLVCHSTTGLSVMGQVFNLLTCFWFMWEGGRTYQRLSGTSETVGWFNLPTYIWYMCDGRMVQLTNMYLVHVRRWDGSTYQHLPGTCKTVGWLNLPTCTCETVGWFKLPTYIWYIWDGRMVELTNMYLVLVRRWYCWTYQHLPGTCEMVGWLNLPTCIWYMWDREMV